MSEQTLKYEDYIKKPQDGLNDEIKDAQGQQEARKDTSTPTVNWEDRYKELEKLNSRQAQTLGEYRRTIDEFIANPTSSKSDAEEESKPISWDDLSEDPNSAVLRAVDSHPAIREARQLKEQMLKDQRDRERADFASKHQDYQELGATPEFQNWVVENPTRMHLYQRADQYDFNAADALFSLYKAEQGLSQATLTSEIQKAELVSSSGELVQEPPRYSRSEYINKLKRSKQGDLEAEDWVRAHARGYREALQRGNVRD